MVPPRQISSAADKLQYGGRRTFGYGTRNATTRLMVSYIARSGISLARSLFYLGSCCGSGHPSWRFRRGENRAPCTPAVLIQSREDLGWSSPCVAIMVNLLTLKTALFLVHGKDVPPHCLVHYFLSSERDVWLPVGRSYVDLSAATSPAFFGAFVPSRQVWMRALSLPRVSSRR